MLRTVLLGAAVAGLGGCSSNALLSDSGGGVEQAAYSAPHRASRSARDCLVRAMYFESLRSSREGLLAVGTVVMNRVESPKFPSTVCAVVSQKRQFAPGVMTRKVRGDRKELEELADQILAGKRHRGVKKAKFFHQAGLIFPYKNMHYVLVAGGNAFYEKRSRKRR